jgi:hypothetical protein
MVEEDFTILEQVPSVVHINVGGQLFLTSRDTLYKVCSFPRTRCHSASSEFWSLKRILTTVGKPLWACKLL